jgi:small subunit ribosomal protein S5
MYWVPKTRLGKMVEKGEIKTMSEALRTRLPLREPEIVDILLPNLEDEVLDVNMVQRMTDSGRRVRFAVTTVVGNGNGYVGLGRAKGKEVGPTIRKAIDNAKLNIIEVKRGCGSWECGCGTPHSFPFTVSGKEGSVVVTFKPAPRGITLAVGDVTKPILSLAGIKDAWAFTKGHTKTTTNYATAAFEALKQTAEMRVTVRQAEQILTGSAPIPVSEGEVAAPAAEVPEKKAEPEPAAVPKTEDKPETEEKKPAKEDEKKSKGEEKP